MKTRAWFVIAFFCGTVHAAHVDMSNERRTVATDDGIRIDAQLMNDFVTPHFPIGVIYRIENRTARPVAIAEKRCEATFDPESRTITVSVGSEVPEGGLMPRVTIIKPGESRTLKAGATFTGPVVPRFVQIRINVLRDISDFTSITEHQPLNDAQFDHWIETNDAIELNAVPVRYRPPTVAHTADASQR